MRNGLGIIGGLALLMLVTCPAGATTILTDQNSTAVIDPDTSAGMHTWTVDGEDYLYQQWFWYRIGNGPEAGIDTISAPTILTSPVFPGVATISYSNNVLKVDVTYTLVGGAPGSGWSDIAETIRVTNLSADALDLHFFQYSDFDLVPDILDDVVEMVGLNTVRVSDTNKVMSETVVTPTPTLYELNYFANTLSSLNDGGPTTLAGDLTGGVAGDVTWAFQWDATLAARTGTLIISKDKQLIVPEPLTMVSGFLAISGLGMYLRRRTSLKA